MSYKDLLQLLPGLCLAAFASLVLAEKSPAGFQTMDKDADGYLNKQEIQQRADLREQFDRIDSNADGMLDIAEFSAFESRSPDTKADSADEKTDEP